MDLDIKATDSLLRSPSDEEFEKVLRPRRRPWLLPLFSSLLGILPAIVVYLVMARLARETGSVERLYKTPIPEFPTEMRTFEWNYTFTGLRTPESEHAWESIMPFGRGYVFIPSPTRYSLPPGESTPQGNGDVYSVALYHQLHCLSIIRRNYFNLLEGILKRDEEDGRIHEDLRNEVREQMANSHNRHCMDYIRLTLECHADMTIEWERTESDGRRFQVDGMQIPHECKKKSALDGFMREQMKRVEEVRRGV